MRSNENELTKNFPTLNKEAYKTPMWIQWFNLLYFIAIIPLTLLIINELYKILLAISPESWKSTIIDQTGPITFALFFPIILGFLYLFPYLQKKYLNKELFSGATDYIVAYKENLNLQKIFTDLEAKKVPPNTKIYIYAYNREQTAKLSKRPTRNNHKSDRKIMVEEAKAQGVDLNPDEYPVMSIRKSEKHQNGNVNLLQTINIPVSDTPVKLTQYLPTSLNISTTEIPLQKPTFQQDSLTEIVIRVTVYSENEFISHHEALLNPMETAFCIEI